MSNTFPEGTQVIISTLKQAGYEVPSAVDKARKASALASRCALTVEDLESLLKTHDLLSIPEIQRACSFYATQVADSHIWEIKATGAKEDVKRIDEYVDMLRSALRDGLVMAFNEGASLLSWRDGAPVFTPTNTAVGADANGLAVIKNKTTSRLETNMNTHVILGNRRCLIDASREGLYCGVPLYPSYGTCAMIQEAMRLGMETKSELSGYRIFTFQESAPHTYGVEAEVIREHNEEVNEEFDAGVDMGSVIHVQGSKGETSISPPKMVSLSSGDVVQLTTRALSIGPVPAVLIYTDGVNRDVIADLMSAVSSAAAVYFESIFDVLVRNVKGYAQSEKMRVTIKGEKIKKVDSSKIKNAAQTVKSAGDLGIFSEEELRNMFRALIGVDYTIKGSKGKEDKGGDEEGGTSDSSGDGEAESDEEPKEAK